MQLTIINLFHLGITCSLSSTHNFVDLSSWWSVINSIPQIWYRARYWVTQFVFFYGTITVSLLNETRCEKCIAFNINMNIFCCWTPWRWMGWNPHTVLLNQRLKKLQSYTKEKNIDWISSLANRSCYVTHMAHVGPSWQNQWHFIVLSTGGLCATCDTTPLISVAVACIKLAVVNLKLAVV